MISVWFAEDVSPRLRKLCLGAGLLIAGVIILSISRTGFAALVILSFFTVIFNIRSRWNARNFGIVIGMALVGSVMVFKAWDSLASRFITFDFETEYLTEEGDRGSYFRKGFPALEDNPVFGVGLNNWSYWISNRYASEAGYFSESYPSTDTAPFIDGQEPPAHNLFLITAVELGMVGLVLLLILFGRWLYISGTGFLKSKGDFLDRIRLGAFLSLGGVLMQSVTEWEFRQTSLFFLGHIVMSVAAFIYYHKRVQREIE